jgi:hypothetical protein
MDGYLERIDCQFRQHSLLAQDQDLLSSRSWVRQKYAFKSFLVYNGQKKKWRMIKSVISDLGKVIIFFDNHIFFKKIARYSLLSEDEIVAKVYENLELLKLFDTGKVSPDEFYGRAKALLQTEIDQEAFYSL